MRGIITKGIGGFYYVSTPSGEYECRARGKFRIADISPLAGDSVEFEAFEGKMRGYLLDILPRKNELKRPPVANVDQLLLVLSASVPKPDLLLVDKLLIQANLAGVDALICLNKCDEADGEIIEEISADYEGKSIAFMAVSAKSGEGLAQLRERLSNKITCLAGQSAVGKSSILNTIFDLALLTGVLSKKTARGRHTTREATLLPLGGNGYVVDTAGFSLLELPDIEPEDLAPLYTEFEEYAQSCRFSRCMHERDSGCGVRKALAEGLISKGRYDRYLQILAECKEKRKRRYD